VPGRASLLPGVRNTDTLLEEVILKGTANVVEACKEVYKSSGTPVKLLYTSSALVVLEKVRCMHARVCVVLTRVG
jgi:nucleoside-diphosphate-sugar epimerase